MSLNVLYSCDIIDKPEAVGNVTSVLEIPLIMRSQCTQISGRLVSTQLLSLLLTQSADGGGRGDNGRELEGHGAWQKWQRKDEEAMDQEFQKDLEVRVYYTVSSHMPTVRVLETWMENNHNSCNDNTATTMTTSYTAKHAHMPSPCAELPLPKFNLG